MGPLWGVRVEISIEEMMGHKENDKVMLLEKIQEREEREGDVEQ